MDIFGDISYDIQICLIKSLTAVQKWHEPQFSFFSAYTLFGHSPQFLEHDTQSKNRNVLRHPTPGQKKACHHSSFKPHFFVFKALRWVFHTGHSDNLTVLTITWSLSEEEKISSKHLPRMLLDLVCRRIGSCSAQMCPELPTSVIFLSLKQINFLWFTQIFNNCRSFN